MQRLLLALHHTVQPAFHLLAELVAAYAGPHIFVFPFVGVQPVGDRQFDGVARVVHGVVDFLDQQAALVGDAFVDQRQALQHLLLQFGRGGDHAGRAGFAQRQGTRLLLVRRDVLADRAGDRLHQVLQLAMVQKTGLEIARMFDQRRLPRMPAEIGHRVGHGAAHDQPARMFAQVGQQATLLGLRQSIHIVGGQAHCQRLGQPLRQRAGVGAVQRQQRYRHRQRILARGRLDAAAAASQRIERPIDVDARFDRIEHQRGKDGRGLAFAGDVGDGRKLGQGQRPLAGRDGAHGTRIGRAEALVRGHMLVQRAHRHPVQGERLVLRGRQDGIFAVHNCSVS